MGKVSEVKGVDLFDLSNRVAVVTGGAGLLGVRHSTAISRMGGEVVIVDTNRDAGRDCQSAVLRETGRSPDFIEADITDEQAILGLRDQIVDRFGKLDILVNNAARNPAVSTEGLQESSRLESFSLADWNRDLAVSLTGAFLCSRVLGELLQVSRHGGVILNISSDLGLIAPNQTLYRVSGLKEEEQPVKPVSYSVVKAGLIGLTRYLATYWPKGAVRANVLCPGGVRTDQSEEFLSRYENLVPLGRMADKNDYEGTVIYMVSDASRYMNGAVVAVDGGRTSW